MNLNRFISNFFTIDNTRFFDHPKFFVFCFLNSKLEQIIFMQFVVQSFLIRTNWAKKRNGLRMWSANFAGSGQVTEPDFFCHWSLLSRTRRGVQSENYALMKTKIATTMAAQFHLFYCCCSGVCVATACSNFSAFMTLSNFSNFNFEFKSRYIRDRYLRFYIFKVL